MGASLRGNGTLLSGLLRRADVSLCVCMCVQMGVGSLYDLTLP